MRKPCANNDTLTTPTTTKTVNTDAVRQQEVLEQFRLHDSERLTIRYRASRQSMLLRFLGSVPSGASP